MPSLASQVNEATIVRAGLDPASVSPAEVYAAKLVLGGGILLVGVALSAVVPIVFLIALPAAFAGYVFPTEYLAYRTRQTPGRAAARTARLPRARSTAGREVRPRARGRRGLGRTP